MDMNQMTSWQYVNQRRYHSQESHQSRNVDYGEKVYAYTNANACCENSEQNNRTPSPYDNQQNMPQFRSPSTYIVRRIPIERETYENVADLDTFWQNQDNEINEFTEVPPRPNLPENYFPFSPHFGVVSNDYIPFTSRRRFLDANSSHELTLTAITTCFNYQGNAMDPKFIPSVSENPSHSDQPLLKEEATLSTPWYNTCLASSSPTNSDYCLETESSNKFHSFSPLNVHADVRKHVNNFIPNEKEELQHECLPKPVTDSTQRFLHSIYPTRSINTGTIESNIGQSQPIKYDKSIENRENLHCDSYSDHVSGTNSIYQKSQSSNVPVHKADLSVRPRTQSQGKALFERCKAKDREYAEMSLKKYYATSESDEDTVERKFNSRFSDVTGDEFPNSEQIREKGQLDDSTLYGFTSGYYSASSVSSRIDPNTRPKNKKLVHVSHKLKKNNPSEFHQSEHSLAFQSGNYERQYSQYGTWSAEELDQEISATFLSPTTYIPCESGQTEHSGECIGQRQWQCAVCNQRILYEYEAAPISRNVHMWCASRICPICEEIVMKPEEVRADVQSYHDVCAKCYLCRRPLTQATLTTLTVQGRTYLTCQRCQKKSLTSSDFTQDVPQSLLSPQAIRSTTLTQGMQRHSSLPGSRLGGSIYQSDHLLLGSSDYAEAGSSETQWQSCSICLDFIMWDQGRDQKTFWQDRRIVHKKCAKDMCPRCGFEVFRSEAIPAHNRVWHPACFTCDSCGRRIQRGAAEEVSHTSHGPWNQRYIYHPACYKTLRYTADKLKFENPPKT